MINNFYITEKIYLLKHLILKFLNMLFLTSCRICFKEGEPICSNCLQQMYDCEFFITPLLTREYNFKSYNFSLSDYTPFWRKVILSLKHSNNYMTDELLMVLSEVICNNFMKLCKNNVVSVENKEIIISYIPSSWARRLKGKNNNYYLANKVFQLLKKEMQDSQVKFSFSKLVEFKFFSVSQAGKTDEQRRSNRANSMIALEENFSINKIGSYSNTSKSEKYITRKSIIQRENEKKTDIAKIYIFLEDVITTGATVETLLEEIGKYLTAKDQVLIITIANLKIELYD